MNMHQPALQLLCSNSLSVWPILSSSLETAATHPWIWKKTLLINVPETSPTSQRPIGSSQGRVIADHGQRKARSLWDSWPDSRTVKSMNNLPPHLKKVSLSKCICGAMNRRYNCTIKERSHYPSKVGVNWRIHGSVGYLVTWNESSEYSYISQRNLSIFRDNYKILWLWAALKKSPPNQKNTKPFDPLLQESFWEQTHFPIFLLNISREDKLSDLTTGRKCSQ